MSNAGAVTSVRGREMTGYLPGYYATSRVMQSIIDAQGTELDQLRRALDETLAQMFVSTATWGLATWERELGIPTDPDKPLEQRRSLVFSKLRGFGTVTKGMIRSVAEAYSDGAVEVKLFLSNLLYNGNGETGTDGWHTSQIGVDGSWTGGAGDYSADWDSFVRLFVLTSGGSSDQHFHRSPIAVVPGTSYTLTAEKVGGTGNMTLHLFWYSDLPVLGEVANTDKFILHDSSPAGNGAVVGEVSLTAVAPAGARYVIATVTVLDSDSTLQIRNIRLNEGSTALPYETRKDNVVGITFVSEFGVPPNIGDLQQVLEEILPAHLALEYRYRYLTWDETDNAGLTWDAWDALGLTWDQTEIYQA